MHARLTTAVSGKREWDQTDWWIYLHVFCIFWSYICLWFVTFVAVVWYICRCFLLICSEMLNLFSIYFFILKSIHLAQNKGIFVRSKGESWKGQGVRWYVPLVFSTVIWSSQEDTRTPKLKEREDGVTNLLECSGLEMLGSPWLLMTYRWECWFLVLFVEDHCLILCLRTVWAHSVCLWEHSVTLGFRHSRTCLPFTKYLLSSVECWCLVDEVEAVMSSVISAWLSRSDGPI